MGQQGKIEEKMCYWFGDDWKTTAQGWLSLAGKGLMSMGGVLGYVAKTYPNLKDTKWFALASVIASVVTGFGQLWIARRQFDARKNG